MAPCRPSARDSRGRWAAALVLGGVAVGLPAPVGAVNGLRPRVATDFGDVPCMVRVDRSSDPTFHIAYSISMEDLELDPVDVDTGRTHQFLALGRHTEIRLPAWIGQADVDEAAAKGLVIPGGLMDVDMFETSPLWPDGSWQRITPDAPRIPISFDAAMAGVDWDTTGAAAGAWRILGYTWDPEVNLTTVRDGMVMVVDGEDPASYEPGVHVRVPDESLMVREGETLVLDACIDAMPGTTVALAWVEPLPGGGADWVEAEAELVGFSERGEFRLEATVPFDMGANPAPAYGARLTVEDPLGRTYVAYTTRLFTVLENGDPPGGSTGGETEGDGGESGSAGGCGCRAPGGPGLVPAGMVLVLAARRRGRPGPGVAA